MKIAKTIMSNLEGPDFSPSHCLSKKVESKLTDD